MSRVSHGEEKNQRAVIRPKTKKRVFVGDIHGEEYDVHGVYFLG
jgi:hypothetical protein